VNNEFEMIQMADIKQILVAIINSIIAAPQRFIGWTKKDHVRADFKGIMFLVGIIVYASVILYYMS